jgi:hypothetical protein
MVIVLLVAWEASLGVNGRVVTLVVGLPQLAWNVYKVDETASVVIVVRV